MCKSHGKGRETSSDEDGRRRQAADASQATAESGSSQEHAQRYWTFVCVCRNCAKDNKADRKGENKCNEHSNEESDPWKDEVTINTARDACGGPCQKKANIH